MTVRVFYDRKDFFGNWEYDVEDATELYSKEHMTDVVRKCVNSFGKVRSFCFRIETGWNGELYVVEQSAEDAAGGVYTVSHRRAWNSIDSPVKMSGAALKRLIRSVWDAEHSEAA